MKDISKLTGKSYRVEDCYFFRNYVQAAHYYTWGCELVDLFVDDNMKWVYVFKREDHLKVKDRWAMNNRNSENENNN